MHVLHPETANDNESSQPISTIYPEAQSQDIVAQTLEKTTTGTHESLPVAANDLQEIEAVRESLRLHAQETESEADEQEVPYIKPEEELANETVAESAPGQATESAENHPQTAQATSGGAEKKDGGDGGGSKKSNHHPVGGGSTEEKKKPWAWRLFGSFLKVFWMAGAAVIWAATTSVRKLTETAFRGAGYKDGKGGGSAPKPSGGGGGHGGGGHGGGGHH